MHKYKHSKALKNLRKAQSVSQMCKVTLNTFVLSRKWTSLRPPSNKTRLLRRLSKPRNHLNQTEKSIMPAQRLKGKPHQPSSTRPRNEPQSRSSLKSFPPSSQAQSTAFRRWNHLSVCATTLQPSVQSSKAPFSKAAWWARSTSARQTSSTQNRESLWSVKSTSSRKSQQNARSCSIARTAPTSRRQWSNTAETCPTFSSLLSCPTPESLLLSLRRPSTSNPQIRRRRSTRAPTRQWSWTSTAWKSSSTQPARTPSATNKALWSGAGTNLWSQMRAYWHASSTATTPFTHASTPVKNSWGQPTSQPLSASMRSTASSLDDPLTLLNNIKLSAVK